MRHLFLGLFLVAALLGVWRSGLWLVLSLGCPVAMFALAAGREATGAGGWRWSRWPIALPTALACLLVPCLYRLIDAQSGRLLVGWTLWGLWMTLRLDVRRAVFGQLVFSAMALGGPVFAWSGCASAVWEENGAFRLVDIRGGRRGVEFLGLGLEWPGPDTAVVERYLGEVPADWTMDVAYPTNPFDGQTARRMALLPNDDARRQVLLTQSSRENLLWAHQAVLLELLAWEGRPDDWWEEHAEHFVATEDEDKAREIGLAVRACLEKAKHDFAADQRMVALVDRALYIADEWEPGPSILCGGWGRIRGSRFVEYRPPENAYQFFYGNYGGPHSRW